jgi:hypothetical protein
VTLLHATITIGVSAFLLFAVLGLMFPTPKVDPVERLRR